MPRPTASIEGFVLSKKPPAETFQTLTVFSADLGLTRVLQRVPRKPSPTAVALDLFDEVALVLEAGAGGSWFVKEARVLSRHQQIGRRYAALQAACAFAALITRNAIPDESRAAVHRLVRVALGAFEQVERADVVYFKSVYCFARDEGHPLKQQWWPTLPADDRADVLVLLNQPAADQPLPAERVTHLQRRLEEYLQGHTEIVFD